MIQLVRQTMQGVLQETAMDMTRFGQKLAGLPVTRRAVPFMSANLQLPEPDPTATVATNAVLTGHIKVRRNAIIGERSVLRADTGIVDIGRQTKLGKETVVLANAREKTNPFAVSCVIGHNVEIGDRVVLTCCKVEDNVKIGDDCRIGDGAIVEKGAVLEKGTVVPAGRLVPKETRWGGNPAKYLGPAHDDHH